MQYFGWLSKIIAIVVFPNPHNFWSFYLDKSFSNFFNIYSFVSLCNICSDGEISSNRGDDISAFEDYSKTVTEQEIMEDGCPIGL